MKVWCLFFLQGNITESATCDYECYFITQVSWNLIVSIMKLQTFMAQVYSKKHSTISKHTSRTVPHSQLINDAKYKLYGSPQHLHRMKFECNLEKVVVLTVCWISETWFYEIYYPLKSMHCHLLFLVQGRTH